jgi:hypothetical protein
MDTGKDLFIVNLTSLRLPEEKYLKIEHAIQKTVANELATIDQTGGLQGETSRISEEFIASVIGMYVPPVFPFFSQPPESPGPDK